MRTLLLSLALLVSTAHADDKARAKALYETGLKHYNLAEYDLAIKAWKESYLLSKRPLLLFNLGQAYRLAGDCTQAMTFYDSYQREEPNPKNQGELDQAIVLCKDKAARPTDKPPVTAPPPPATTPPPPLAAAPQGAPAEPVDPPRSSRSGGGLRMVGIAVGATGVVLAGVGIYFALDSGSASDELDGHMGPWGPDEIEIEARGERSEKLAWILGGAGVAALVTGGVMFAIGGPKQTESSVTVAPARGGLQVGWSTSF
jgi:tetratricopeptide (TPR) repeat protein